MMLYLQRRGPAGFALRQAEKTVHTFGTLRLQMTVEHYFLTA